MTKNLIVLLFVAAGPICAQGAQEFTDLRGEYLGQTPPGDTPVVFALGIVSTIYMEHSAPTFSPDGTEVFWRVAKGFVSDPNLSIVPKTMKRIGDRWTVPMDTSFGGSPFFSPDGQRLYFSHCLPDGKPDGPWFVEREGNTWSAPRNIGLVERLPELKAVHGPTVTRDGTLYFAGDTAGAGMIKDHVLYRAKQVDGEYTELESLPRCINLPDYWNYTPFIAPDESYLIFSSNRPGSLDDHGDLYITFHDVDEDTWSEPVNMPEPINTRGQESSPGLSPDGKYLFFTRPNAGNQADIFWVSAAVIDRLEAEFVREQHRKIMEGQYLGQALPGDMPAVFARGIVATDALEHSAPAFSPDGNEVFWSLLRPATGDPQVIMTARREGDTWSAPTVAPFSGRCVDGGPVFSVDGQRLYFGSADPAEPAPGQSRIWNLWFVEKQANGWSERQSLGLLARFGELQSIDSPSIADNGTLYFMGHLAGPLNDSGIYRSELVEGEYAKPEPLPRSINLPPFLNWTPWIAPDESYLLFSSNRTGSLDDYGDLYISYRTADSDWTDPVNIGGPVSTGRQERFPALSPDGKYLFFTRWTPDHDQDVFWVSARIIAELKEAQADETVQDIDGNIYKTVTIGTQVWMAEDLRTTCYRNGDLIGSTIPATLDINGQSDPKYQWAYDGDEKGMAPYGRLYTWYAAVDPRGLAPSGWHVPTNEEWRTLCDHLGGPDVAGAKLKAVDNAVRQSFNDDATNSTGFTALPSGSRWANGTFSQRGECVHYWTNTAAAQDPQCAWRWLLQPRGVGNMDAATLHQGYAPKTTGWPIRCVRDTPAPLEN